MISLYLVVIAFIAIGYYLIYSSSYDTKSEKEKVLHLVILMLYSLVLLNFPIVYVLSALM